MKNPGPSTYSEFVAEVRKFNRLALLEAIAALAPAVSSAATSVALLRQVAPWALAQVAKASMLCGNDFRHRDQICEKDIVHLANQYQRLPTLKGSEVDASLIPLRLAYEQFPFMTSDLEEWARSIAIFERMPSSESQLEQYSLLGESVYDCPVSEVVYVLRVISAFSSGHRGWWSDEYFLADGFRVHSEKIGLEKCVAIRKSLTSNLSALSISCRELEIDGAHLQAEDENPLWTQPIVEYPDGRLLVPIPRFLDFLASPDGFASSGYSRFKNSFTGDLGKLVEAYAGKVLASLPNSKLIGEREIGTPENSQMSVDWIVELPEVTLLIEVKAARPLQVEKAGSKSAASTYDRGLAKAFSQIQVTKDYLLADGPVFDDLRGGHTVGLVVTLEPFYLANSGLYIDRPEGVFVSNLRELEDMVQLPSEVLANRLLTLTPENPESKHDLRHSLKLNEVLTRHELIQAAAMAHPGMTPEQ